MVGIPISEKYGVNPSIPLCFYCGEPKNEVALLGRLPRDREAPHHCLLDMEPCDTCVERRETHIHLIVLEEGEGEKIEGQRQDWRNQMASLLSRKQRPFIPKVKRTGLAFWIDRDQLAQVVTPPELAAQVLAAGWSFIPPGVVEKLGLDELVKDAMENHPDAKEVVVRGAKFVPDKREKQSDA